MSKSLLTDNIRSCSVQWIFSKH